MHLVGIRLVTRVAVLAGLSVIAFPVEAEMCGIDRIFADGYEVAGFVSITQLGGSGISPGLTQSIVGSGTLSVTLTSPSTTSGSSVDIAGTFVGPVNTGITINGIAGYTSGSQFLVPGVPLAVGSNALNAVATTLPGSTATASGSISRTGATPISVASDRPVGYAPFAEKFTYLIGALPAGATINSVAINFKGTGPNDYSGALAGAPTSYTYLQPGLYTAQFQFTDTNSVTYQVSRSVLIQDIAVQRGMLCDVYGYLKDRLAAQDATGASYVYQSTEQSTFLSFFTALGSDMPAASSQLGVIINGIMGGGYADLLLVRDNADQTRSGYPLRMSQSADGVWRISEM